MKIATEPKSIRIVMLAAVVVWLLPLIAWSASPPAGQVDGNDFKITGGGCLLLPIEDRADLIFNEKTKEWMCDIPHEVHYADQIHVNLILIKRGNTPIADSQCRADGGEPLEGACWFHGRRGASCSAVCRDHELAYSGVTQTLAGGRLSGGSHINCNHIARLFGLSPALSASNNSLPYGCYQAVYNGLDNIVFWAGKGRTTAWAKHKAIRRFCACESN